jgi:hypothetical protein
MNVKEAQSEGDQWEGGCGKRIWRDEEDQR